MKSSIYIKRSLLIVILFCLFSCEKYLEIPAPNNKLTGKTVFSSDQTALSAMVGIYNQLYVASFSAGWQDSVTALAGLSGDNVETLRTTDLVFREFQQNEILPANEKNLEIWSSAYNIVYNVNSLLEGIDNSGQISPAIKDQLEGQAKFVRAFTYFYLVNLYGEVPLILSTSYQENALASRKTVEEVNQQIIADLNVAIELLPEDYPGGERTFANKYAAMALLAREYLFKQEWDKAEALSAEVIGLTGKYELVEDLNQVFLVNSREAIWQISPLGRGNLATNTNEGSVFIINPFLTILSHFKLSNDLIGSFEEGDKRLQDWIGFNTGLSAFYAFKYKIRNSTEPVTEYSMVLRLAEQYLIRAEARARKGNQEGAIADLNTIRERAGIPPLNNASSFSKQQLVSLILEERRRELFAEWGNRWLDLKRTEMAGEILPPKKPLWQDTNVLYPIPAEERSKNPNLDQNPGY